jgi:tetratricopeptide (TPR) repeat protein
MKPEPRYKSGDRIGGRYFVHKALLGGMGEVYLCLDLQENSPIALKTFQQRYVTDVHRLRRAFEQEVATWVALEKHPNIVRCFWMQMLDNQPFMALEWVAGEERRGADLRGWLRHGPLDLKLALEIALDICNGLSHAQAKQPGLVHRDLKPENILIAQGGLAKITDFGLAQIVEAADLEVDPADGAGDRRHSLVGRRGIAGTPAYMAPEQWRGELLDVRTDIYALGCILYEMLAGTRPFTVDFAPTIRQQVQQWLQSLQAAHESSPPPRLPASLAPGLDDLLQHCLAKTPSARPANLTELSSQLVRLYHQHFVLLPPERPAAETFSADDYSNRGNTYDTLGQHQQALEDYGRAIKLSPSYAAAYSNRGLTYAVLGRHRQALDDFDRAIVLDPDLAQAYYNRGNIWAALEKHQQALDDYGCAIALDRNLTQAYFNRGNTYHALGQHQQALANYDRVVTLDPTDASAYYNRGATYHALGQIQQALADYDHAIALNPTYAKAYFNRGKTHHALGQHRQALADFDRVLALNPTDAATHFERGNVYFALGQHQRALDDYSRAIRCDQDMTQAYCNRGAIYRALGQYAQALTDYAKVIDLAPNDARAYYHRGLIHHALSQQAQALDDFVRAITLDPDYAAAYVSIGALLANQDRYDEALLYFEQATRLGDPTGAQYAAQVIEMLEQESETSVDFAQQALQAFADAGSFEAMRQAVGHFPALLQIEFMAVIEQVIAQQVPPEQRPAFQQRLAWLRQIAAEQQ